MASPNQGLQIALIAAVMLALILGVTTFLFYKQYDDQRAQAETAKNEKAAADQARADAEKANRELKRLLGVAETDDIAAISTVANDDFNRYGGASYKDEKNYRKMLAYLNSVVHERDLALADLKKTNDDLNKQLRARAGITQPQIDAALAEAQARTKDLQAERDKFSQDRDTLNKDRDALAAKISTVRKEAETAVAEKDAKLNQAYTQVRYLQDMVRFKDDQVTRLTKPTFETADGQIVWVSQRDRTVWINLGSADGLPNLASFSVFPVDTANVANAPRKGSIEVTEVVGDHLAKARILEDQNSEPIIPGDLIHTPIWSPGERKHFAIIGFIDLDDDDRSDLKQLLSLIRLNGGVVDAYQDENGNQVGQITRETHYLIKGKEPRVAASASREAGAEKVWVDTFSAMEQAAKSYLVKERRLSELLAEMGYKSPTQVTRFGPGVPARQFKPQLPEGGQRVSTGSVSPLFQPRRPPQSRVTGAY